MRILSTACKMIKIENFGELLVRSSIHVLMTDATTRKPMSFGSGCIIKHLNKYFFISVAHVTNKKLRTCLETNLPSEGLETPLECLDGLVYLNPIQLSDEPDIKELEALLQKPFDPLDITFAEIKRKICIHQEEIDFRTFKVEKGEKLVLNSSKISRPSIELEYGFYGKIRQDYDEDSIYLKMTPTIKAPLKFHRQSGNFYIFLAPEIINDAGDYEGCSGAPIMDIEGNLVALACKIFRGSKMIYGFSIHKCLELMDMSIRSGLLEDI